MKINEIAVLTESQHVDEAPYGALKSMGNKIAAKFGSQRAADAGAIGKEANALKKQFVSFAQNSNQGQPTKELLLQYLQAKGFPIADTKELDAIARSAGKLNPSLAQKLAKGWKQFKKGMPKLPKGAEPTKMQPNLKTVDGGKDQQVAASMYEAVPKSQIVNDKTMDQIFMYIVKAGYTQRADMGGASAFAPNAGGSQTKPQGAMSQGKDGVWRFN